MPPAFRPLLLALAALAACPQPDEDEPPEEQGPVYATEFLAVELDGAAPTPLRLVVQACAGLKNRAIGGSVYVLSEGHDAEWLEELALLPSETLDASAFLDRCAAEVPRCVRYRYDEQQEILPAILTAASALGALPLDEGSSVACGEVVLDARTVFAERNTPELATRWVFENLIDQTTGLAMLNPGYEIDADDLSDPPLTRDMPDAMVDFLFSRPLFATFLVNGCSDGDPESALLHDIVNHGGWATPLGVYGYNNSWLVQGFLHEAQTRCLDSRNMGAIPTETGNLSFFSTRRPPIEEPGVLRQNELEDVEYDPTKTYVAFIVGDGDNVRFIMTTRNQWLRQRLGDCALPDSPCAPITWSISPQLPDLAPDVLEWYYTLSQETGSDYFTLPPSGALYAYPSSLAAADQDRFVAATEDAARLLDLGSTVHWDWFETWEDAEQRLLPKYAGGPVRGIYPVNVPYLFDAFPGWPADRFFHVLTGAEGGEVVVFRPRQWRGIHDDSDPFFHSPQAMAEELVGYPPGTVAGVYMTSDGGLNLENSFLALARLLPEDVVLVSADTAARLALEAGD